MDKWDIRFLELAKLISTWSKDPSTQMGAVIVAPDRRIVSTGFNGFPQTMLDEPDNYNNREEKLSRIIHCEMNALLFAERSVKDCCLYTYPLMTCDRCFVHMIQSGITRFVAPKASPDKLVRWKEAFDRVKEYAKEAKVELLEIEL